MPHGGHHRKRRTGNRPRHHFFVEGPQILERAATAGDDDDVDRAAEVGARSIAFAAISCGVYGYPLANACRIAIDTTLDFLTAHPGIAQVIFILFSDNDRRVYERYLQGLPS